MEEHYLFLHRHVYGWIHNGLLIQRHDLMNLLKPFKCFNFSELTRLVYQSLNPLKIKKMKKCKFPAILFLIVPVAFFSCSKSGSLNSGDPNTSGDSTKTGSVTDTIIATPNNPDFAKTIGFFGDSWTAKTFSVPNSVTATVAVGTNTSTVTVDMSKVLTKVSNNIYGNNTNLWMGQFVTQPTLLNYITDLAPHILRGPAGSNSDVYFFNALWNEPPADAPEEIYENNVLSDYGYWYGKNTQSWTFSLDNYYDVLSETSSEGILTVNYGYARYGTSADPVAAAAHLAADWVRYDNGRTKYWEIGNECYGSWEAGYRIDPSKNKDGQPEIITGELYGNHFKVFADSMRVAAAEVGKTIYIGAVVLDAAPASWADNTNQTWNQEVFTTAGADADFFVVHDYFTDYNTNSSAADILASATSIPGKAMTYLKSQLSTYGIADKPIAMTEWNIQAVGSKQQVSNIAGVHAVITLAEFIKNEFGEASRWDLANGWNNGDDMGMFSNSAGGAEPGASDWNPRPAFYYMYYFQKCFGDRMVNATVSADASILAYGSSFASGECGVILINKGSTAKTVSVKLDNFLPGDNYYWYTLNGGTDNGDFSTQVYINGTAPSGSTGGPLSYSSIKANAAKISDGMKFNLPAYSATFVVASSKK